MPHSTLRLVGLIGVVVAVVAGGPGQAAPRTEPPPASPSGGEPSRVLGNAELTREQLAEFIRTYRGPDPADFEPTDGEIHQDDEGLIRTVDPLSTYAPDFNQASALDTPAPTASWKAMDAAGGVAADTQVAASTTNVIVTNRTTIAMFDKAGTSLGTVNATALFQPLGLGDPSFEPVPIKQFFDVRSIFDPFRKRFWVAGLGIANSWKSLPPASIRHIFAVAVSKTENPLDGWYLYWWDTVPHWGIDDDIYDAGDASD